MNDQLAQHLQELSSAVTAAGLQDAADLSRVEKLLAQIRQDFDKSDLLKPDLVQKAIAATSKAQTSLKGILNSQSADAAGMLSSASKSIAEIQALIDKGIKDEPAGGSQSEPAFVISAEDAPLVNDFVTESSEHVESAEGGLLILETQPGDAEAINRIFRAFHTIKGMAGFLNLAQVGSLAHAAENLLDKVRKGTLTLQGERTDIVFASLDMLKKMIAELKKCVETSTPVPPVEGLSLLLEQLAAAVQGDTIKKQTSDIPVKNQQAGPERKNVETPVDQGAKTEVHSDDKIKVGVKKLDNLVNMVGELVIAQSIIAEQVGKALATEHDLCRKVGHQGKIIRELQELSMALRMVPIAGVFQKMTRLVRDLSHKSGKEISLITSGEETEIDRNIVDSISDPLVHMIRNSVDHGIESPDVRIKSGKAAAGRIELNAFHQGGNIVVQISDDGKGLDKTKILKKAVDAGLVAPGQELSEQEIFKLIFHAGLSTAEKVTEISGRGVGMDVVRKNIEALRGKIEIESTLGVGSRFTLRLPLTLAIIDGQLVKVGSHCYIIPIVSIEHSLRPTAGQISTVQNRGEMVNVRSQLLPLIRLYDKFNVKPRTTDPCNASLVVIEGDQKRCCVMVDELLAQQQVVIKSLGEQMGNVKGVSGAAILGDGTISLILDVAGLMQVAFN